MTWEALGRDPVPGDPGAVRALARRFEQVAGDAMALFADLRRADGDAGPQVWRGPAADTFREQLAVTGPQVIELAGAFRGARSALQHYADALEDAQCRARQAEVQAADAIRHRDAAVRERDRAEQDKATYAVSRTVTAGRLAQVQAIRLGLGVLDPSYALALDRYEDNVRAQHDRAVAGETAARARERAAEQGIREGEQALRQARECAERARQARDEAARTLVRDLRNNEPVAADWVRSFIGTATHVVDGFGGFVDELADIGTGRYRVNGTDHIRWKRGWGEFGRNLNLRARTVSTAGAVGRWLGRVDKGFEVANAAGNQYRSDLNRVDISEAERLARTGGAAVARSTYEVTTERAFILVFGFAGSLIPVPGVGTALGIAAGVAASELFDEIDDPLEELVTRLGAEAFGGAARAFEQAGTLVRNEVSDFTREAGNTAGAVWKGITTWRW